MKNKKIIKPIKSEKLKHFQEPVRPFPYREEEVFYKNKAVDVTLAGTLTLPKNEGPFPAALLISGMGPNDRDYTMLGHKLFLLLADYLTCHGIAVLRFDKRGVGKSTGEFNGTLTSKDFADDVMAGIEYLKKRSDINAKQIGLIGHSEGGMIASMIAVKSNDISFLVSMAGVVLTDSESVIQKVAMQLRADGATDGIILQDSKIRKQLFEIVKNETNSAEAERQLNQAIDNYSNHLTNDQQEQLKKLPFAINKAKNIAAMFNSQWYRYFLNYKPVIALEKIKVPVLVMNGDCDFIVSSKLSIPVVDRALKKSGNIDYTILELPNMNHWFQTCKTGAMTEYANIEETISPSVLKLMSNWILIRVNKPKKTLDS